MNLDLLIPVVILFILMRLQGTFKIAARLLSGLKIFVPKRFMLHKIGVASFTRRETSRENDNDAGPDMSIEEAIARLDLTMVEIGSKDIHVLRLLKLQPFYELFEALVQIGLAVLCTLVYSSLRTCFISGKEKDAGSEIIFSFSTWPSILSSILVLLGFQSLLQVLYLTGLRAFETKVAAIVGIVSSIILLILFPFVEASAISQDTLRMLASHVLILVRSISPLAPVIDKEVVSVLIHAFLAMLLSACAAACTIPSLRFTQTLLKITSGRSSVRAGPLFIVVLWLETLLPLVLAVTFATSSYDFSESISKTCAAPVDSSRSSSGSPCETGLDKEVKIFSLQIIMLITTVFLRFFTFKKHLQCFMDHSTENVADALRGNNAPRLRSIVESRSRYLLTAATQLLSGTMICFGLAVLLIRNSPATSALVGWVVDWLKLGSADVAESAVLGALARNTTADAAEWIGKPYFAEAVLEALGVKLAVEPAISYSARGELLQIFVRKAIEVFPLPSHIVLPLTRCLLFWFSTFLFINNLISLALWQGLPGWLENISTVSSSSS